MNNDEALVLLQRCREDPVFFCREVLGVNLWNKQEEIMKALRDHDNVIVASGHGVGKTFLAACACLWFLFTHKDSRVITTAPTARQVESILWAEIASLYIKSRFPLGGNLLKTSLTISEKHFAIGLSTDQPDRFQGHHAEHILLIMDEAPGVDPLIYEAAQGILTSRGAKTLLIGNPTTSSGPFFDYFTNKLWEKFHISCYDSPAIKSPELYPTLTTLKWIEERKEEWGESSPMFISRVLGEFPAEGEDTLIPLTWISKAQRRFETPEWGKVSDHVYIGLDVARYGNDRTVLTYYVPNRVLFQKSIGQKDLMKSVQMVVQESISAGAKLMQITCDDTGLGGGVVDRLRELGYPAVGVNFSQKPHNQKNFRMGRDEMYWGLRELFRSDEIAICNSETLAAQLSAMKYKVDPRTGRMSIETKEDMRKRGLKSPDFADSLCLAVYGVKRQHASAHYRGSKTYQPDFDLVYY